ncbi:Sensor histidine kinase AruS [Rhodospirillaceae bacterium LM-1]|nr:Sensor histidine kinase AruS [Rhodospirillaceae bacterium LM-1]
MKDAYKLSAWLAGSICLVSLGVGLILLSFREINDAAAMRVATHHVIADAEEWLSMIKDAETSERGYLLTGDEKFLEPYLMVRDEIKPSLARLRQKTVIVEALAILDSLGPLADMKIEHMATNIDKRRVHGQDAILNDLKSGVGMKMMGNIRLEVKKFVDLEERILERRDQQFEANMREMLVEIIVSSAFVLILAILFAIAVFRRNQQRLAILVNKQTQELLQIEADTNVRQKAINDSLQESQEKLSVTLNSIGDAVIATDVHGCVTLLNPQAEQLTGWKLAEANGRPIGEVFNIINQSTRMPSAIPVLEALAKGTIQGLANHTVLVSRHGSECIIADSCAPIRNREEKVIGAVLVFRDVTDEYNSQQESTDSAALIKTILNTVVDGIVTLRANDGSIETANPAAERMFDYTADELIGKRFSLLIPELDQGQNNGTLEYFSEGDKNSVIGIGREVVGRRKDGSVFPLEIAVGEMWQGDQRYFTGVLRDITSRRLIEAEQKKLDQKLHDLQFYTRSLIESNIDALMTTDPLGIVTDVNMQMEVLTGCTRDELVGTPFKNYFTDPHRAEAGIKLVLEEKKVTNYELTAKSRDGKETEVSYNATTFYDRNRKLQGVFAAARDISERKRLDIALQEKNIELESATSLAEKANLAKSEFLSSMSHELRSPLNAILGFAQLMESDPQPPTSSQKESIVQILQAGWHLLKLINEILDLAKIESRQVPMSKEPVSLAEVMLECQSMIEPQAQQRGITMRFPEFNIPYFVTADRTRVKQVIINLLSNSIKYNVKQGTVEVLCTETAEDRIRVSIVDTGIGMSSDQMGQLFQAFNRLGQEAGGEEGTGIGLVVAKRLVELMGGTIGVESVVGSGSVFWFELVSAAEPKLAELEEVPVAATTQHHLQGSLQRTLLYVEDNPANLKLVQQIIARHPELSLMTATDGTTGVALAESTIPEVILMDINLPGISGLQALELLQSNPKTSHIPIIAISANAMPRDVRKGLDLGFYRYLTKPIKLNEFMEALDSALEFAHSEKVRLEG